MNANPLTAATRTVRHINRYRQILTVLMKYGFEDILTRLRVHEYLDYGRQLIGGAPAPHEKETTARRLRLALQDLGPTFIKLGQMLSTRPDLIPDEYVAELALLREHVPPFEFEQVREIVTAELGRPLEAVYAAFADEAFAAASIGQAHRAQLLNGDDVVVKVQRPNIHEVIAVDLEILEDLAVLAERRFADWQAQKPSRIVAEFGRVIQRELDFTMEAAQLERFAAQFVDDPTIYLPKVYRHASAERVLTLEYVPVTPLGDAGALRTAGYDTAEIAHRGAELTLKQIFVHGYFHADPHPGNIFVLPGNVICLLDFGMVGRLTPRSRIEFAQLIHAMAERDSERTARALLRLTEHDDASPVEPRQLERDVADFIDANLVHALERLNFGKLLRELMALVNRHQLMIPTDLVTMLKAAATVEQMATRLNPQLDMVSLARPYVRRVLATRYRPRRLLRAIGDTAGEFVELARDIPGGVRDILRQAKRGGLKIGFEHRGLQPMLDTNERIANRVSFAIVVAALIVGSSVIVHSQIPPRWYDVPVIGIIGYLVAGIMGLILLIAILRHGRL